MTRFLVALIRVRTYIPSFPSESFVARAGVGAFGVRARGVIGTFVTKGHGTLVDVLDFFFYQWFNFKRL